MILEHTKDITVEQLKSMIQEEYVLIDLRDEFAYNHGCIPGAKNMTREELESDTKKLPDDKKIIVYCMKGTAGEEVVEYLLENGYDAYNLSGGYGSWLTNLFD